MLEATRQDIWQQDKTKQYVCWCDHENQGVWIVSLLQRS